MTYHLLIRKQEKIVLDESNLSEEKFNRIEAILSQDLDVLLTKLIESKRFPTSKSKKGVSEDIRSCFYMATTTLDSKKILIELLLDNKRLLTKDSFTTNWTKGILELCDSKISENETFQQIKGRLFNIKPRTGTSGGGKGEVLIMLLSKEAGLLPQGNARKNKSQGGDVSIEKESFILELKNITSGATFQPVIPSETRGIAEDIDRLYEGFRDKTECKECLEQIYENLDERTITRVFNATSNSEIGNALAPFVFIKHKEREYFDNALLLSEESENIRVTNIASPEFFDDLPKFSISTSLKKRGGKSKDGYNVSNGAIILTALRH